MFLLGQLSIWGCRYHRKRSDMYKNTDKRFAYHVYMMKLHTEILGLTLDSNKLREKYLK